MIYSYSYAVMVYIEQYYITKVSQKHALCILGVHKWPCLDHKSRVNYCHRGIPVLVQKFFIIKVLWRSSLKCADNFDACTEMPFYEIHFRTEWLGSNLLFALALVDWRIFENAQIEISRSCSFTRICWSIYFTSTDAVSGPVSACQTSFPFLPGLWVCTCKKNWTILIGKWPCHLHWKLLVVL